MSRKTVVSEMQAKEITDSHSPVRRSARIFSGNNTPSGLGKRNLQADLPAKVTKTRRGSTQLSEDDSENSKKDLINKDSQQAPVRRGRKSSVTTETANKEEPEKPKTIRTRRNSRAASEDKEKPPPKAVKGRKSSITSIDLEVAASSTSKVPGRRKRSDSVDSEPAVPVSKAPSSRKRSESADIKAESPPATTKLPTRASTRRRNSVTDEAAAEGTSTPARRTTRGRKASDSENVEEDVKPVLRKGLRSSTDEATGNTPSKTPRRLTRRNSFTAETVEEEPLEGVFKEMSVKITPIKKKLIEKVEAELDLSVINESSGDLNVSKQSLNEEVIVKDIEMAENNLLVKVTPTKSIASEEILVEKVSAGNAEEEALNESLFENSSPSRKRPHADDYEASTRKSPKISSGSRANSPIKSLKVLTPISPEGDAVVTVETVKYPLSSVSIPDSTTQTPDTEVDSVHTSKDKNEENLDVEVVLISKETSIKEGKIQEDALSTSKDSNKENLNIEEVLKPKDVPVETPTVQENALNVTIESNKENSNTGEFLKGKEIPLEAPEAQEDTLRAWKKSNKENLDNEEIPIEVSKVQEYTLDISKDDNKDNLDNEVLKSKDVCVEPPVVNPRISNVFRPNQKENSFVVEPMEVDDLSIISADNSIFDKISASGENSVVSGNAPKSDGVADTTIKTIQESSSIFNKSITSGAEIELTTDVSSAVQDGDVTTVEKVIRINAAGSEEDDNVVVEETENSVDISCIPKLKKPDAAVQANNECSLIVNTTVDNVKILNRKSSSPISQKKVLRKSRSPINVIDSSSDNDDKDSNKLHINKVRRRSKLKSKTPSPKKLHGAKVITLESTGSSSSVIEDLEKSPLEKCQDPNGNTLKVDRPNRKSKSKSLSPGRTIEGTSVVGSAKSTTPKSSSAQSREAKIKRISEGAPGQINVEVEINLQGSVTPNLSPRRNKRLSRSPTFVPWESNSSKVRMSRDTTTTQTLHRHTTTPIKEKKSFSTGSSETKKTLRSNNNTPTRKKPRTPSEWVKIQPESDDDTENSSPLNVNEDENQENIYLESKTNKTQSDISGDAEKSRSDPKFSQSTHYDFELPSDEDPTNSQEISIAGESAVSEIDVICTESIISPIKNESTQLLETTVAINSNELNFSKMSGFSNTDTVDLNETAQQKSIHIVENIAIASSESHEKCNSDNSNENDEIIDLVDDKEMPVIEGKSELGNTVLEIKDLKPKHSVSNDAIPFADTDKDKNITDEKSNVCNNKTKENSTENAPSTVEAKTLPKVTCLLTRLEDFASAKVEELSIREEETTSSEEKASNSEDNASSADESRESEQEYNNFIDGMAEEGEEDTPSEDSNQIVDQGEYIGSSETDEYGSDDDYDSKDSFICNDEEYELLSGDEYDLENEKKQKKERAIVNTLGEKGNIVEIPKKELKIKKSRIIRPKDSSSEDEDLKASIIEAENSGSENSVIVVEDSPINQTTAVEMDSQTSSKFTFDNSQESESLNTEETAKSDSQDVKINASSIQNISTNALNNSIQKRNRKTSLSLQENIVFDGVKDPMISQRISTLVESFCSTVTKGEVSLNLSLEYEGTPSQDKEKQKITPVKVLSSIKICPASDPEKDPLEEPKEISTPQENLSRSLDSESGKRRKKLKRRLSKSLSELCEEETQSKRRRNNSLKALPNMKPAESYNLMNQLITDVKNRPKRTIKPSLPSNADSSWISSEVIHMKPSTTAASRAEMFNFKAKLHPKDFKNKLLSDPTRVKRIQTKALLKKKGAFL